MTNLYNLDYGRWLENQLAKLKARRWEELDVDNLIAELEQLNRSNKRELFSYSVVLLAHLLKWQYQPQQRSGSWEASINHSRRRIERLFNDQPSLRNYLNEILQEAYEEAKEWASIETKLNIKLFPGESPYSGEQILAPGFFPT